jgi:hypothetical protein
MKTILTIVMVLSMTAVYEPDSIIPKYFIDKTPQGEYRVYDSKQIVVPKYIVKPDRWGNGYRVYETGKPVLPVYSIERKDALQ